jgi:hypothetical protein
MQHQVNRWRLLTDVVCVSCRRLGESGACEALVAAFFTHKHDKDVTKPVRTL